MKKEESDEPITLEEYDAQFWSCQNCFCGLCVESCPAYRETHNEAVSARGLAQIGLGLLSGELQLSELSDEILYACTGCRWCETVCSMNTPIYIKTHGTRRTKVSGATMAEIFRSARIEDSGHIPAEVRGALDNISRYGNPFGEGGRVKDTWVESLGLSVGNKDTILYVGATVPYEDRSTQMAEAIVDVLKAGHLAFSMLGSDEKESGALPRMLGEEGLFLEMVEYNTRVFKEHHVTRIICLSPHDYDVFIRYYKDIEAIEVKHYTQMLHEMVRSGMITYRGEFHKRVAYHDPCYLGRQHDLYEEPRKILEAIPGIELLEMERSRETALCCGGGGSGLFLELPRVNMDKARADHIRETNADCVAVACPHCYQMLDSAIRSRSYDIEVKDLAQLVREALEGRDGK